MRLEEWEKIASKIYNYPMVHPRPFMDVIPDWKAERERLIGALEEAKAEIEYCHSDMLTPEERSHPRGSGWARVWDKICVVLAEVREHETDND